ncbi:hypothetical protein AB2T14_001116 [Clostridium botulinum]
MECPAKSDVVNNRLCELFYPYGCGVKCKNLYKKWLGEEKEVVELEESANDTRRNN